MCSTNHATFVRLFPAEFVDLTTFDFTHDDDDKKVARKLVMMEQDLERAEERAEHGDLYVDTI